MKFFKSYYDFSIINESKSSKSIKINTSEWEKLYNEFDNGMYPNSIQQLQDVGFIDFETDAEDFIKNHIFNPKSIYFDQKYVNNKYRFDHDKKEDYNKRFFSANEVILKYIRGFAFSKEILKKFTKYPFKLEAHVENSKLFFKNSKILKTFLGKYKLDDSIEINNVYEYINVYQIAGGDQSYHFIKDKKIYLVNSQAFAMSGSEQPSDDYDYWESPQPIQDDPRHDDKWSYDKTEFKLNNPNDVNKIFHLINIFGNIDFQLSKNKIKKSDILKLFKDYPNIEKHMFEQNIKWIEPNEMYDQTPYNILSLIIENSNEYKNKFIEFLISFDKLKDKQDIMSKFSKTVQIDSEFKHIFRSGSYKFFESYNEFDGKEDLISPVSYFYSTDHNDIYNFHKTRRGQLVKYSDDLMSYNDYTTEEILDLFIETLLRLDPIQYIAGLSKLYDEGYTKLIKKYSKVFKKNLIKHFDSLYKDLREDGGTHFTYTGEDRNLITFSIYNYFYLSDDDYKKPFATLYLKEILDAVKEFAIDKIVNKNEFIILKDLKKDMSLYSNNKKAAKYYSIVADDIIKDKRVIKQIENNIDKNPSLFSEYKDILSKELLKKYKHLLRADNYKMFDLKYA